MYSYVPQTFSVTDDSALVELIRGDSFATIVSSGTDPATGEFQTWVSHVPVLLETHEQPFVFSFHLANSNHHTKALQCDDDMSHVLIIKGPHSYISPSWYAKKPAVPTWNYAVAHFEGEASVLNAEETRQHVLQQVSQYEPELVGSDVMTDEFVDKLNRAITGFRLHTLDTKAKFKLGQNRHSDDVLAIKRELAVSDNPEAVQLARLMTRIFPTDQG